MKDAATAQDDAGRPAGVALTEGLGAVAEARMRRRALMRAFRAPVDWAMLFGAWLTMYHATDGSMWAGFAACVAVGAYGLWCFADGCA
jgi:hypothetical protein